MPSKNSLTIRLAEPNVFLNPCHLFSAHGHSHNDTGRPSLLRGILTLQITKPTRISSIEVELQGKSRFAWIEGFGPRSIEITEDHKLFSAKSVLFLAKSSPSHHLSWIHAPSLNGRGVVHDSPTSHDATSPHLTQPSPMQDLGLLRPPSYDLAINQPISQERERFSSESRTSNSSDTSNTSNVSNGPSGSRGRTSAVSKENDVESPSHLPRVEFEDSSPVLRARRLSSLTHASPSFGSPPHIPEVIEEVPRSETPPPINDSPRSPVIRNDVTMPPNELIRSRTAPSPEILDAGKLDSLEGDSRFSRFWSSLKRGVSLRERSHSMSSQGMTRERSPDARSFEGERLKRTWSRFSTLSSKMERAESGNRWKEFEEGEYNYPISFSIPADVPPSVASHLGRVLWRLKAYVHRPGALAPKLTATQDVLFVSTPGEEDTEDTEYLIFERLWETFLHYHIALSGKSFHIGGVIPFQLTFVPLEKVKIYRILVWLEERVDYHFPEGIMRTEPLNQIFLLSLRGSDDKPLLPMTTSLNESHLSILRSSHDDESEMAAEFMGPGPWTIKRDLKLPASCRELNFTNRNRTGGMVINHTLKILMRVQKTNDSNLYPGTNRPKQFDIIVQVPVHILSCWCTHDWTSLPFYSEIPVLNPRNSKSCPCSIKRRSALWGGLVHPDRLRNNTNTVAIKNPSDRKPPEIIKQVHLFERLISGQENEVGQTPPSYASLTA